MIRKTHSISQELPYINTDRAIRTPIIARGGLLGILFLLMVLFSTYDKFGFLVPIGGHSIHCSPYKALFIVLVILLAIDYSYKGRIRNKAVFNQQLYRFIWLFVLIQTFASLLGSIYTLGTVKLTSEIYYLVQRSTFIIIPLLALRYKLSPKSLLKFFMGAILIHYLFIALQFVSPVAYRTFVEYVFNPAKADNVVGWGINGVSQDFVGLQSTSNYGSFAAAFGLLMLAFTPKRLPGKLLILAVVFLSIFVTLFGPSRAVLIMVGVTLLVFIKKRRALSKASSYFRALAIAAILVCVFSLLGTPNLELEDFASINRFSSPSKGYNFGKLIILQYSLELFLQSPIVGWGRQRFSDISYPLGNVSPSMRVTHFYFLTTLISSGLVGFVLYLALFYRIVRALWQRKEKDYAIVCAMFIAVGVYNFVYDAGHLDVFACFNGIAAYYALLAINPKKHYSHEVIPNEKNTKTYEI